MLTSVFWARYYTVEHLPRRYVCVAVYACVFSWPLRFPCPPTLTSWLYNHFFALLDDPPPHFSALRLCKLCPPLVCISCLTLSQFGYPATNFRPAVERLSTTHRLA